MEDDNNQSVVRRDSEEGGKGERVIKKYLGTFIKANEHIEKALLIRVIDEYVMKNSELFTRLGIMMHLIVMHCVNENLELPHNFTEEIFIAQAANWHGWRGPLHPLVEWVINEYNQPLLPNIPLGKSWLIGYTVRMFHGNTITSIKGKWLAVIKDSIDAFARVVLQVANPPLSDLQIERTKKEIRRQILTPASQRPNTAPDLLPDALELVQFHRQGFHCAEGVPLNKWYIANGERDGLYHHFVLHYGHCLRRQENLENAWNVNHLPAERIGLKKRTPLPFYKSGHRKSVSVDQKGLYYILRSYVRAGGDLIHDGAPWMPNAYNNFQPHYGTWVRYLFDIDRVLDGRKRFKLGGVGFTTSGVRVSIHYFNLPRPGNIINLEDPDEQSLAQSIANLSLHPQDVDDEVNVFNGEVNDQANGQVNENNDVEIQGNHDNIIFEEPANIVNDDNHGNDQAIGNDVHEEQGNEIIADGAGDEHFVDIGHDPVVRLDINGETFAIQRYFSPFTNELSFTSLHSRVNYSIGRMVFVVDPGNNNILYIHVYLDGVLIRKIRLSRNYYYQESMLNYSRLRWIVWNNVPEMRELITGLRDNHFKTSNMDRLHDSVVSYSGMRENIHLLKLRPRKYERNHFFIHRKKKSSVHRFLSRLAKSSGERYSLMFYGNGEFAPGGRGQRSVPCKWVKRECRQYFDCYSVDEFRTSQICPRCNDRLFNVRKHLRNGKIVWVRGLKYCASDVCRAHRYKDRDSVGCHNIFRKTRTGFPEVMRRSNPAWDEPAGTHEFRSKY